MRAVTIALAVAVVVAVLGAPYGLLWSVVAPEIPVIKVDGGVYPADAAPEQPVAGDGWFAILGVLFGVLIAFGTWAVVRRHRGVLTLVAMSVGAVAAGALAAWLGQRIGLDAYDRALAAAEPGALLRHPPDLRIAEVGWWFGVLPKVTGVQLVAPFAAAVTYTLLAGWSRYPSLRPEPATFPTAWEAGIPGPWPDTAPVGTAPAGTGSLGAGWGGAPPTSGTADEMWRRPDPEPTGTGPERPVSSGSPAPPDRAAVPAPPGSAGAESPPDRAG